MMQHGLPFDRLFYRSYTVADTRRFFEFQPLGNTPSSAGAATG
jgi:hypothetical protein